MSTFNISYLMHKRKKTMFRGDLYIVIKNALNINIKQKTG